ncbi:P-loop containing nucleoside triphosphate hydrolase protein [Aspergillus pseudoustus]|uniref:ATP-dependent RNA helicase n=1 Tax=Aspergillus pseudoustus TaxID=1810923 RepID=A0ABR4J3Y2_9EURO
MAGDRSAKHDVAMKHSTTPTSEKKSHKRKRDIDGTVVASSTPSKKSRKDQDGASTPVAIREKKKDKRSKASPVGDTDKKSTKKKDTISSTIDKRKAAEADAGDKQKKKKSKEKRKHSGDDRGSDEETPNSLKEAGLERSPQGVDDQKDSKKEKKHKESKASNPSKEEEDDSHRTKNKFAGILSKFERSAKVKEAAAAKGDGKGEAKEEDLNTAEPVIAKGLEPIPQPEPVLEEEVKPTYSSLPEWLANPLRTSAKTRTKFSELGIEPKLLRILEDNGYKEAFAVQSAVIPLILKGPQNHPGDLCVSAATGSGKTLSYVLPLVTELELSPAPRLRGLIVVPTRELVKQAREACEFCTAGSGLRVGSAVGNVAIKDEQRSLMRVDQVYSPESVKSRQQAKLTADDWTDFSLQEYISTTADFGETLPGYIHVAEPNVDILMCTPGRLVDHIRYTKGFTLKHLQWLVIDEADRLLNESFQEWVDVVMTSLDTRKAPEAFGTSGQFLAGLGLPLQTAEPRKVILSATMTRDISKLNSLRLTNPQLVIVGTGEQDVASDKDGVNTRSDDKFTLPTTLKEHSVAVGDGAQKPLYLLRLLLSEIKIAIPSSSTKRAKRTAIESDTTSSDETSSDDTSSDETSSDESTSSDASSDSESDSDSDSDSTDTSSSASTESDSSDSSSDSDSSSGSGSGSDSDSPSEPTKPAPTPSKPTVLIFTKSSESASRLSRLLSLLNPSLSNEIGTIIKSNKSSASRKTLTAYRRGKLSIIIATDRASRGLDLASLTHVVNYDVPASLTTYVHRVGRTARAGREGSAWTLVAHREGRWFMNEIAKGSDGKITRSGKVERVAMKLENAKEMKSRYAAALEVLEKEVKGGGGRGAKQGSRS